VDAKEKCVPRALRTQFNAVRTKKVLRAKIFLTSFPGGINTSASSLFDLKLLRVK
jgi:hypothetical protein